MKLDKMKETFYACEAGLGSVGIEVNASLLFG